jgi:hypothetical protein
MISFLEEFPQTKPSKMLRDFIPANSVRVTFDRTFKNLKTLGLIETEQEQPYRSPYLGTFLHGYSYQLTVNGQLFATKLKKEIEKQIEEYWDLIKAEKESTPKKRRRACFCASCGTWHWLPEEAEGASENSTFTLK